MIQTVTLELPTEIINTISIKSENVSSKIKELLVYELYREHRISAGKASEIIGISKEDFIKYTSRIDIPHVDYSIDDIKNDLKNIS